jgi:hypothetical protein
MYGQDNIPTQGSVADILIPYRNLNGIHTEHVWRYDIYKLPKQIISTQYKTNEISEKYNL